MKRRVNYVHHFRTSELRESHDLVRTQIECYGYDETLGSICLEPCWVRTGWKGVVQDTTLVAFMLLARIKVIDRRIYGPMHVACASRIGRARS